MYSDQSSLASSRMIKGADEEMPHFAAVILNLSSTRRLGLIFNSGSKPPLSITDTPTTKLKVGKSVLCPSMFFGFSMVMPFSLQSAHTIISTFLCSASCGLSKIMTHTKSRPPTPCTHISHGTTSPSTSPGRLSRAQ